MTNKIHETAVIDESVKIGNNCIVGAHTVIMKDVVIGNGCIIGPLNVIEAGARFGDYCTMQPHCVIARDTIIEDNVFIGPHFSCSNDKYIKLGEHGTSPNKQPWKPYPLRMKKGARLGSRVTLAPDVTIGENALVDMCCFVTHDVPDNGHFRSSKIIVGREFQEEESKLRPS